jgi:hypothetical protein
MTLSGHEALSQVAFVAVRGLKDGLKVPQAGPALVQHYMKRPAAA